MVSKSERMKLTRKFIIINRMKKKREREKMSKKIKAKRNVEDKNEWRMQTRKHTNKIRNI